MNKYLSFFLKKKCRLRAEYRDLLAALRSSQGRSHWSVPRVASLTEFSLAQLQSRQQMAGMTGSGCDLTQGQGEQAGGHQQGCNRNNCQWVQGRVLNRGESLSLHSQTAGKPARTPRGVSMGGPRKGKFRMRTQTACPSRHIWIQCPPQLHSKFEADLGHMFQRG